MAALGLLQRFAAARQCLVRLERTVRRHSFPAQTHAGPPGEGAAPLALLASSCSTSSSATTGSRLRRCVPTRSNRPDTSSSVSTRGAALSDTRLVGASVPLRYDAGDAPLVSDVPGIAELSSGLTRGFRYSVWSEALEPTVAQLEQSKPIYPVELVEPGTFLDLGRGITSAPFGQARVVRPELERYAPLARMAERCRQRANAVRRNGRARVVVPDDRRLPVHRPAPERRCDCPARRLRDSDTRRGIASTSPVRWH